MIPQFICLDLLYSVRLKFIPSWVIYVPVIKRRLNPIVRKMNIEKSNSDRFRVPRSKSKPLWLERVFKYLIKNTFPDFRVPSNGSGLTFGSIS